LISFFNAVIIIHHKFVLEGMSVYLFRSDGTFVCANVLCQKQAVMKQPLAAVACQRTHTLHRKCEPVSCPQINLRNPTSPLLARLGSDNLFTLPRSDSGPKRRALLWQYCHPALAYPGGCLGGSTPPPRNSEVLKKLGQISSFLEYTSVTN
jgi:hypothetical protein